MFPTGSVIRTFSRSVTLPWRASTRRIAFGSLRLTVRAALGPIATRRGPSFSARRLTETAATTRQSFAFATRTFSGPLDQEREQGLRSAAAPIGDATGQVVAAVNVSVLAGRTPLKVVRKELVPAVMETAAAITQDLASDTPLATGSLARS